ncbi:ATP-dependent DNA ligase [Pseudonocardiaceae bacterium YIM PH 21723]|nr:ATP-dependent DNA ligase [Pseudonocardiaceae bacterium YIM PH 21723]
MALPLTPPVQPMLASPAPAIPDDRGLIFEPKWDGFRCLVFADGGQITLQSRSGRDLARYFPEVVEALGSALPDCVLDGELVVDIDQRLDFDALTERIHPAKSRVTLLAGQTPARYIAFDALAIGEESLVDEDFRTRRAALEKLLAQHGGPRLHLTPATEDPDEAREWFTVFEGAGLDGVIGKPADGRYTPNKRTLLKFKHERTADCVVAGLRWYKDTEPGTSVGSLMLGLHDDQGRLHHVGVVGSFTAAVRRELATELADLITDDPDHPWLTGDHENQRLPGAESRWRSGEQPWVPLRPDRVLEVRYEHTEGHAPKRFRHTARFHRWRPDRTATSCDYAQLDEPVRYDLEAVLHGEVRAK